MTGIQATDVILASTVAADDDAAPRKSAYQRFEPTILGTGTIVLLLLVWQFLPDFVPMKAGTKLFFTVPSHIAGTLWTMFATGSIWAPVSYTHLDVYKRQSMWCAHSAAANGTFIAR